MMYAIQTSVKPPVLWAWLSSCLKSDFPLVSFWVKGCIDSPAVGDLVTFPWEHVVTNGSCFIPMLRIVHYWFPLKPQPKVRELHTSQNYNLILALSPIFT